MAATCNSQDNELWYCFIFKIYIIKHIVKILNKDLYCLMSVLWHF